MFLDLLSKYAKLIVNYCVNIKKGAQVVIWGPVDSIPLITEIYREVLRNTDGNPMTKIEVPGEEYIFYKEAKDHQLVYSNPFDLHMVKNIDVSIKIRGFVNTRELSNVSPEQIQKHQLAQMDFWKTFFERQGKGEISWIVCPYPSEGMAQEASMSKEEFANLIVKTCLLDKPDPIAEWKNVSQKQQKYCDYLDKVENLHVIGKGTDITLSVKGRKWENCDGKKNLPDGEIFTGPIEDSINGTIAFSFPGFYQSRQIENVVLTFEKGMVVEASATKGQEILDEILKIPGAKHVGEFAIGINYGMSTFVKNILFDEKIGGTIHMALGNEFIRSCFYI